MSENSIIFITAPWNKDSQSGAMKKSARAEPSLAEKKQPYQHDAKTQNAELGRAENISLSLRFFVNPPDGVLSLLSLSLCSPTSYLFLLIRLLALALVATLRLLALAVRSTVRRGAIGLLFDTLLLPGGGTILLIFLLLLVLDLVFDEIVESGDGADQAAEVDGHELVVGLDAHGAGEVAVSNGGAGLSAEGLGSGQVRQKIEDVLQVAEDGVVDGQVAVEDFLQVGADVS